MSELQVLAHKLFWWKSPREVLQYPKRLLAQVMVYGTPEDVVLVKQYFSNTDFLEVLKAPPVGVFDARSWAYWHLMLDKYPPPPLPTRQFNKTG